MSKEPPEQGDFVREGSRLRHSKEHPPAAVETVQVELRNSLLVEWLDDLCQVQVKRVSRNERRTRLDQ